MLAGDHIELRAVVRNDLTQLLEWRNRPEFRRYFREYRELNMDHQIKWFETVVQSDPSVRMFSIVNRSDGSLIGACGLCYIDWINRNADISIYIGVNDLYIDDLFAPDALSVLVRYGFDELELHRVWTEIYDFDKAKIRLLEGFGFRLDGRHRETHWTEGSWHDSLYFGLLASEVPAAR